MKQKLKVLVLLLVAVGLVLGTDTLHSQKARAVINGDNQLVSYDSTNTSPVGGSYAVPSDDGNFVAFMSTNQNVVSGDTGNPGSNDLFLRNMKTNTTVLVDQSTNGVQAYYGAYAVSNYNPFSVSRTGRYVLFTSGDTHLIDGQTTDGYVHVYLRDTVLGTTSLVDQTASGVIGNNDAITGSISDDGRFAVFSSTAKNLGGGSSGFIFVYMKDMSNGNLYVLSRSAGGTNANIGSGAKAIASCEGSMVAFTSAATNLTPTNNGHSSVYLVDLRNGFNITNLTVAANNNAIASSISCNGRYVTLISNATNLTTDSVSGTVYHTFRYDRITGGYVLIDKSSSGYISTGSNTLMQNPGRNVGDNGAVLFALNDKNVVSPAAQYLSEVYLRTPEDNTTELVAINSSGQEGSPGPSNTHTMAISADGKSIIHASVATNLIPGVTTVGAGTGSDGNIVMSKVH